MSGTSVGRPMRLICSSDLSSGDSPPCMHRICGRSKPGCGCQGLCLSSFKMGTGVCAECGGKQRRYAYLYAVRLALRSRCVCRAIIEMSL